MQPHPQVAAHAAQGAGPRLPGPSAPPRRGDRRHHTPAGVVGAGVGARGWGLRAGRGRADGARCIRERRVRPRGDAGRTRWRCGGLRWMVWVRCWQRRHVPHELLAGTPGPTAPNGANLLGTLAPHTLAPHTLAPPLLLAWPPACLPARLPCAVPATCPGCWSRRWCGPAAATWRRCG